MNRKLSSLCIATLLFGLVLIAPAPTFATPITGTLNVTGDATVAATTITFLCDLLSPFSCPANTGQFQVTGPAAQSGSFSSLALTLGNIMDLNAATQPVNQTFSLPDFMTFMANPNIVLDLTFIHVGTGGSCPPSGGAISCTPLIAALATPANPTGRSPFILTDTSTGATVAFSVSGNTRNVATSETVPFNGTFTSQFTNVSVAQLLSELATSGTITASYSGEFVATTIPEPATTFLFIGGGLLFAATGMRRRRRS